MEKTRRHQTYRVSRITGSASGTWWRAGYVCECECECRHILIYLYGISSVMDTHTHTCIAAGHGAFYCVHLLWLYGGCTAGSEQVVSPV